MHPLSYSNSDKSQYEIHYRWSNYVRTDWVLHKGYSSESDRNRDYRYLKIKYKDSPREYIKVNNI